MKVGFATLDLPPPREVYFALKIIAIWVLLQKYIFSAADDVFFQSVLHETLYYKETDWRGNSL